MDTGLVFHLRHRNMSHFVIRPMSGWEETFNNEQTALNRAAEIIEKDVNEMRSRHGYSSPEQLVEEAWDSIEEMYKELEVGA